MRVAGSGSGDGEGEDERGRMGGELEEHLGGVGWEPREPWSWRIRRWEVVDEEQDDPSF